MFIFTADNHLGVEAQWSIKERKHDFLAGFASAVESALKHSAPLVIGGDLFDMTHPPSFAVEHAQNHVRAMNAAGLQVFGIDGNHDIANGKWLRVCGIIPLHEEPVSCGGFLVCGLNYQRSAEIVRKINEMADRGVKCDVLVLHLAFGELNRMGAASDLAARDILDALKAMGTRLVLMGHIHIQQQVVIEGIIFAYSGSTEVCTMNEPHQKTVTLINDEGLLFEDPIKTRVIDSTVIGNENEFAAFADNLKAESDHLQAVYVARELKNGVKRLRDLAKEKNVLMRIQTISAEKDASAPEIDRTEGIIGLEQAIGKFFPENSEEAGLVRALLRSPEAVKPTVEAFMKKGES